MTATVTTRRWLTGRSFCFVNHRQRTVPELRAGVSLCVDAGDLQELGRDVVGRKQAHALAQHEQTLLVLQQLRNLLVETELLL